ncbi:nuclear transport factor 2 family protein [Noviherbaspirillum saxi]|uniref:Nuclear transport factor 2 family protein n=1 Tax=Noviherbaspirillum saxi TaxID=2320863 RepID=A0A3A3G295_9BURK|nr:nuclear transport factor 2 family protein [Noviherbaspirillum saxi]RJF92183.1 nuclear transport factor 2 family protein [Noviherbaspirillum saxi]
MMNSQESKQLAMLGYQKFQSGDIQGLLDLYTEDIEWVGLETENIPFSGTYRGKAGVAEFFRVLDEAQQVIRFEPQDFIADGDKVAVTGQATWLVRSTGQTYESPWVHIFTMQDGKVKRFHHFNDTAAATAAYVPSGVAATQQPDTGTSALH